MTYSRPIEMPKTRRDGLANFVQLIINSIEAGDSREALLRAVDLLEDITCGQYDDAMTDANAVNAAVSEAQADMARQIIEASKEGYERGVADEKARMAKALELVSA